MSIIDLITKKKISKNFQKSPLIIISTSMVSQWEVKQAIVKIKNKPQKKLCINLNVIDTFILTELGIPINYRHVLFSDSKNLLLMRWRVSSSISKKFYNLNPIYSLESPWIGFPNCLTFKISSTRLPDIRVVFWKIKFF